MLRHTSCLVLAAGMLVVASQASAQKKINVKLTHSAAFGHLIAGKHVIIGAMTGDCARDFAGLLAADVTRSGVQVVSTADLGTIPLNWPMTAEAVAQVGRRIGPSILITAEILRCEARKREQMLGSGLPASHISRVEGFFQAQLHALDIAAGREAGTYMVRADAQKQNESQTGIPEYPAESEVRDIVIRKAITQAQRLYLPWIETREIAFMDDKDCSLRAAFDLATSGDFDAALRVSRDNAASCSSNPKVTARAWYNVGILSLVKQKYDEALAAFDKAEAINNKKLLADLTAECRNERALAEARRPAPAPPAQEGPPAPTGIVLTNDFLIKLVQGNVAEEEILEMIRTHATRFTTDAESIRKLKDGGASDAVISAMVNKK